MVINPAGGVVFTSNEGAVDRWVPDGQVMVGAQSGNRADHAGITSSTRPSRPRGGFA